MEDGFEHLLAEGNLALSICEGMLGATHCSFYDLYRIDNGKIVEHWDTVDAIPPPDGLKPGANP